MTLDIRLQSVSDWLSEIAEVAEGVVRVSFESGLLKDSLEDLCKQSGAAGAVFKLGAMSIPKSNAEQRIASALCESFLRTLDRSLASHEGLISRDAWRKISKKRLQTVATRTLKRRFTWIQVFGRTGRCPARSWPLVLELADFGRALVAEAAIADHGPTIRVHQACDDIRGALHRALASAIDELLSRDKLVQEAFAREEAVAGRESLMLLAQHLSTVDSEHLFGEIPQDALYVRPRLKFIDCAEQKSGFKWDDIEYEATQDLRLVKAIAKGIEQPRLIVVEGEMGVGKSCLMRTLVARFAIKYLRDNRQPPVFARWRDIHHSPDVVDAIANELHGKFGLPFHDLNNDTGIVYFVDGFDEMRSHQDSHLAACFDRLRRIVSYHRSTVVVALRSTVVTEAIRMKWQDDNALVVHLDPFFPDDVDQWTTKWKAYRRDDQITGDALRSLCQPAEYGKPGAIHNPLLLFMLARYVYPIARDKDMGMSRTEVFRIFVDETVAGKARSSGEEFPFAVPETYRFLLQEMAYIASCPKYGGNCPERKVRNLVQDLFPEDLPFEDVRTAFVLHFFHPSDGGNEFEFHPEGFRQYLLAEWVVRAQLEAFLDSQRPQHGLSRERDRATDDLAQFPLQSVERELVSEIYEDLLGLSGESDNDGMSVHLWRGFGVKCPSKDAPHLLLSLYNYVRRQAEQPPRQNFTAKDVGIPAGQEIPNCLTSLRLLVNYWDQCILASFGLFRAIHKTTECPPPFGDGSVSLRQYLSVCEAVRGFSERAQFVFNHVALSGTVIRNAHLQHASFAQGDLRQSNLANSDLRHADFSNANLEGANLTGCRLENATLDRADLTEAILRGASLPFHSKYTVKSLVGADFSETDLTELDLTKMNLSRAILEAANLTSAILRGTDLRNANLDDACLAGADLCDANLDEASLCNVDFAGAKWAGASLSHANLSHGNLSKANLVEVNLAGADLTGAKLIRAQLHGACLSGAYLTDADLREAVLSEADLSGADLKDADLRGANLADCNIENTDFLAAKVSRMQLEEADGLPYRFPDGSRPDVVEQINMDTGPRTRDSLNREGEPD